MSKNDENSKDEKDEQGYLSQDAGSEIGKEPRLLRKRYPRLRVKGSAEWFVSDLYPNLIIVNWRKALNGGMSMDDKAEMENLQTALQIIALTVHDSFCSVAELLWSPVTWAVEQFNGTADFREWLRKTEEAERFRQAAGD